MVFFVQLFKKLIIFQLTLYVVRTSAVAEPYVTQCHGGIGGAENAGVENAGVETTGEDSRGRNCRSGRSRSRSHGWHMQEWKKQE